MKDIIECTTRRPHIYKTSMDMEAIIRYVLTEKKAYYVFKQLGQPENSGITTMVRKRGDKQQTAIHHDGRRFNISIYWPPAPPLFFHAARGVLRRNFSRFLRRSRKCSALTKNFRFELRRKMTWRDLGGVSFDWLFLLRCWLDLENEFSDGSAEFPRLDKLFSKSIVSRMLFAKWLLVPGLI